MKKILFLLLTVVTVCSCYNDDDLWDKVNDLDGRVETLETTVKKMNSEITTLQSLVDALNQGKIITNTEQTSEGRSEEHTLNSSHIEESRMPSSA